MILSAKKLAPASAGALDSSFAVSAAWACCWHQTTKMTDTAGPLQEFALLPNQEISKNDITHG
jgi:hypothetical protein